MDWFLLFTVGPLLLSVKGIIDLAQMPPTILLPHPGGTGTPTLERIAYLPGAQPPFPPRAFNPASISPGEDPSLPYPSNPMFPYLPGHDLHVPSHFSKSAAVHCPEVWKVSSACPLTAQVALYHSRTILWSDNIKGKLSHNLRGIKICYIFFFSSHSSFKLSYLIGQNFHFHNWVENLF